MMTGMFISLALIAVGLIVEWIVAVRAPEGFQDEPGFHFGRERAAGARRRSVAKNQVESSAGGRRRGLSCSCEGDQMARPPEPQVRRPASHPKSPLSVKKTLAVVIGSPG